MQLDLWNLRWELPIHLLDALFFTRLSRSALQSFRPDPHALRVLRSLGAALEVGSRAHQIQSTPHSVLLSRQFYNQKLRLLVGEWALCWLRQQLTVQECLSGDKDDDAAAVVANTRLLLVYIVTAKGRTSGEGVPEAHRFVREHFNPLATALANLARDWVCNFLPHCFSKINRVAFGLLHPHDLERWARLEGKTQIDMPNARALLAVPFVGKVSGLGIAIRGRSSHITSSFCCCPRMYRVVPANLRTRRLVNPYKGGNLNRQGGPI